MKSACFALAAAWFGLAGCKAHVGGKVDAGTSGARAEGEAEIADFDKPLEAPVGAEKVSREDEGEPAEAPLLGARQDLSYKGPANPTCQCLAVAVGQPFEAAFQWAGERPRTRRDAQLVVAVSSAGVPCPDAGENAPGASYWGYEIAGNDVVVVVENAAKGRPVAAGGIIPRPLAGGQVYVRPADKKVVYGRPLSGQGARCPVGAATPAAGSAAPASGPVPPSGVRIRGNESDPTSTRMDMN